MYSTHIFCYDLSLFFFQVQRDWIVGRHKDGEKSYMCFSLCVKYTSGIFGFRW